MTEWLQIDKDGEINVREIMRQITTHVMQQRLESDPKIGGRFPHFRGFFDRTVYDELLEAARESDRVYAAPTVAKTPLPVIGRIVDALRRKIHELVTFYVNRSAAHQAAFNDHIMRASSALVEELDSKGVTQAEVQVLWEQVEVLKARLDALEGA
jgi:hypothetical protein